MNSHPRYYIAIKDDVCVVTNDPADRDIPTGANAAPIHDFTLGDYRRLRESGINNFIMNTNSAVSHEVFSGDTSPRSFSDWVLMIICGFLILLVIILIVGAYG